MLAPEVEARINGAESLYEQRLKETLEQTHRDWYVAIDPESGEYFLGRTILEAAEAARRTHPDRYPHTL